MTSNLNSELIKNYDKTIEIVKDCKTSDDVKAAIKKLKELEVDFPNIKWIIDYLEQTTALSLSTSLDSIIPDFINKIIERIENKIASLGGEKELKFADFLYSIVQKGEWIRLIFLYSDLINLLLKSRREGDFLLQYIKTGEETRDSLILETDLTFEKIDVKWILNEKDVEEKIQNIKKLEQILNKYVKDLVINQDFSSLEELFNNFDPLYKSIFGKSFNYENYEKKKNLEWIENKIKENEERKAQIEQFDNIEFFLNTTNKNLKKLTYIPLKIMCESCKKTYKVIVKLDPEEYVGEFFEDGHTGFPKENKINCKCGHTINLATMRNQIEKATGKKLVTYYEDDKKMVNSITIEAKCPKCGQLNIAYGKFFGTPRIDKYCQERGARPILKNKPFPCKCGNVKWDMSNKIKEIERQFGLKFKY